MDTKKLIERLRGDPDAVDCEDLYMAADAIEAAYHSANTYKSMIRSLQKENIRLNTSLYAIKRDFREYAQKSVEEGEQDWPVYACPWCRHQTEDGHCFSEERDRSEKGCEGRFWEWRGMKEEEDG